MPLPTLKIECHSPVANDVKVWLGGQPLHDIKMQRDGREVSQHGLTGLDLSVQVGEVNRATLKFHIGAIEIDSQTLAMLQATVKASEPVAEEPEPALRTFGEEPCHAH